MLFLNGAPVPTTVFPDNTSQVWKLPAFTPTATVRWVFSHEGEVMQLAQLKELLDHYFCAATLEIMYLPYGRQDKEVANDRTFALIRSVVGSSLSTTP